jgi:hypothetical protein
VAQDLQLRKFVNKEREKMSNSRSRSWSLVAKAIHVNRYETLGKVTSRISGEDLKFLNPEDPK